MRDEEWRELLRGAIKGRALFYHAVHDEMAKEFGAEQAATVMRRAITRRGREIGAQFGEFAPNNLAGLRDAFLAYVPDSENVVEPKIEQCDDEALVIHFQRCPLKEAWHESGLADAGVAELCQFAGCVDEGTFGEAGFEINVETWQPGGDGCCRLTIKPQSND